MLKTAIFGTLIHIFQYDSLVRPHLPFDQYDLLDLPQINKNQRHFTGQALPQDELAVISSSIFLNELSLLP